MQAEVVFWYSFRCEFRFVVSEEVDIFSATTLPGADDDDEHKVEGRRKDQEAEQKNEQCRT